MRENLTHAIEDYLKVIYEITTQYERASTNDIASILEVTPASVTGMIKKLASTNPPLVDYKSHRGVVLTEAGERIALEIIRHHRLIEMFLHQILGYDWDQVHAEADRLEHVISEEFEERIAVVLGDPSYDPHGDPIPTRELTMPDTSTKALINAQPGEIVRIIRVVNAESELLRYLSDIGLTPGTKIRVVDCSPFDNNLTIQKNVEEPPMVIGPVITEKLFIENCH